MFVFKKRFGQNFLINDHVIDVITDCFSGFKKVIEIGPGHGALTKSFLKKGIDVHGIEIDLDCINSLAGLGINTIHADILRYDLPEDIPIAGNLPYNISAKIVEKIVRKPVRYAVLMFQREVADVLTGCDYGRFTVFAHSRYKISRLINVKPGSFFPVPKVHSQVLIFERIYDHDDVNLDNLSAILFVFFRNRRKMVSSIRKKYPRLFEQVIEIGIPPDVRAEDVKKEFFYDLSKRISVFYKEIFNT